MFLLTKPSAEVIRQFIASQRHLPFSYPEVGATRRNPPRGYTVDHDRMKLGSGKNRYDRAVAALKGWKKSISVG